MSARDLISLANIQYGSITQDQLEVKEKSGHSERCVHWHSKATPFRSAPFECPVEFFVRVCLYFFT